jgi:DNA ligase D-like protein (predicted 3'-phosphoesterase)
MAHLYDFARVRHNARMAKSKLEQYRKKRDFSCTSEPNGSDDGSAGNRFVVHKHSAAADHYDLRLQVGDMLKGWAAPKGPSPNPDDKRPAVHTEEHRVDYLASLEFEMAAWRRPAGYGRAIWSWRPILNGRATRQKASTMPKFTCAAEYRLNERTIPL